jgi:hypothetical protein
LWPPACQVEQQRQKEGEHINHSQTFRPLTPGFLPGASKAENIWRLNYDVRLASKVMIPKAASESIPANPIRE